MLLAFTPSELLATIAIASVAGSFAVRRAPEKAIFNCGQYLIAVTSGLAVFHLIAGAGAGEITLRTIGAAVAGTVTITAVSRLAVAAMISFVTSTAWNQTVRVPLSHIVAWFGAAILGVSVKTVDAHRANIMRKLRLRSVSDLVRYAIRNRIVQP